MEDDEPSSSFNVHFSKGKQHGRKRYFTGKRKSQRQKTDTLSDLSGSKEEPVTFKKDDKICLGWLGDRVKAGQYTVNSKKSGLFFGDVCCSYTVKEINQPVVLKPLSLNELPQRGAHVLFVWDWDPDTGEFIELKPAIFLCSERDYVWVKPIGVNAVRTEMTEVFPCPYQVQIESSVDEVRQGEVNVICMIVDTYKQALKKTQLVFEKTQDKLVESHGEKVALARIYENALMTINKLKTALLSSHGQSSKQSARILILLDTISQTNSKLNRQHFKIVESNRDVNILREKLQRTDQENQHLQVKLAELSNEKKELERLSKTLESEITDTKIHNAKLNRDIDCMQAKQSFHLEQRPSSSAGHDVVYTRPAGSKAKPQVMVPLMMPQSSSSDASTKTMGNRAKEMMKVLELMSSRDQPTEQDLITTLASFMKKFPTLATAAYSEADLSVYKELSPGETLDLKLLLRLPMRKFRHLRTFLKNSGVDIFASDKKMYEELAGRRDVSSNVLEIGEMALCKTVSSAEIAQVPFVRVRNLQVHIESLLSKKQGDIWDSDHFRNEIWIKILGDKGGSSTKLAVQVCNFKDGNSADNTDLVAMFSATDSYSNMDKVFSVFKEDLMGLQQRSQIRVGDTSKICRVFLAGDYEFLTKTLGHMGANSSFPCLWCYTPLSILHAGGPTHSPKLRGDDGQFVDTPQWANKRLPEELVQDLADNKADPRKGGDTKANGQYHHSLALDPILPIIHDLTHVVPPVLHIMLGLVVRFYRSLEDLCKKCDQTSLGERDVDLNQRWEEKSVEVDECEREYVLVCEEQKFQERLLEGFKKIQKGKRGRGASDPCSLPACALSVMSHDKTGDVNWIQCDVCGVDERSGWFHTDCVGLRNVEVSDARFECPVCKGDVANVEDVVRKQLVVVERHTGMMAELKKQRDEGRKELDRIFKEVEAHMGPLEKELGRILEVDLGVKKQAYHSQCFVGNHCQIILKHFEKLSVVLEGVPHEQERFSNLFARLKEIFSFCESTFLSDKDVAMLSAKCWELGEWFPRVFPEERIPPKLHMLICHVPECAAAWNTIGMLGEHGIESIHAQVNADERIYGNVRDNKEKMKLVFANHGQRLLSDKTHLSTSRRKCTKADCDGRYKLVENVKRCSKCSSICAV